MDRALTSKCPSCGSATLTSTVAQASGALALDGTYFPHPLKASTTQL